MYFVIAAHINQEIQTSTFRSIDNIDTIREKHKLTKLLEEVENLNYPVSAKEITI